MKDKCDDMNENQNLEISKNEEFKIVNEEELNLNIQGCVENDRLSQKRIYYCFFGYAMSICSKYVENYEDELEIINDGFLKVFKEMYRYRPSYTDTISSFKGWLAKIMVFTSIDHYRRKRKYNVFKKLDYEAFKLKAENEDIFCKISSVEIFSSLNSVSPRYREILRLFIVEGYSHIEIAKMLNISIGSSKSGLSRGRKQLQNKLLLMDNFYSSAYY